MTRREETSRADSTLPTGFRLVGVTQLDGESGAMPAATKPSAMTSRLGSGVAEVFDSDGNLIMRYQVNERAESQWDVVEYVPPPAAHGPAGLIQK